MTVSLNEDELLEKFSYQSVRSSGRVGLSESLLEEVDLPIYKGYIQGLKTDDLDYLIIASDLQGHVFNGNSYDLLGAVLPKFLKLLFELEFPEVDHLRIGVFLYGDMHARLDKRGGAGDVKNVWRSFNEHFGFVAGVAGNHDEFGDAATFESFKQEPGIHYLNEEIKELGGIKIGGISGIIGRPSKNFRNEERKHLKALEKILRKQPHFLLLHEGPNDFDLKLRGNLKIREVIELGKETVICCGHTHWKHTLVEKNNGTKVINADSKCIILKIE